jgi:hypothetical protein
MKQRTSDVWECMTLLTLGLHELIEPLVLLIILGM